MRVTNDSRSSVVVEQAPPSEASPPPEAAPAAPTAAAPLAQDGVDQPAPSLDTSPRASALPASEGGSSAAPANDFEQLLDRNEGINSRVGNAIAQLGSLYDELKNCTDPAKRAEIEEKIEEAHDELLQALKDAQQFARLLEAVSAGQELAKGGAKTPSLGGQLKAMSALLDKLSQDLEGETDPAARASLEAQITDVRADIQALGEQLAGPSAAVLESIQQSHDAARETVQTLTTVVATLEAHGLDATDAKQALGQAVERQAAVATRLSTEINTQDQNNAMLSRAATLKPS